MGIRKLDFVTKTQFLSVQKLVNTSNQNTSVIKSYFNTDLRVDRPLSYGSKKKFANFSFDNKVMVEHRGIGFKIKEHFI